MKELSIEQKAKAYDEALRQIKECTPDENGFVTIYPNEIFPELKESEDEKIRKEMIAYMKHPHNNELYPKVWISWLEKQGEQKPTDKVEPKFKVGDWIIFNGLSLFIKEVVQGYYRTISVDGILCSYDWYIDDAARLWTIQDAKDGDVLTYPDGSITLFKYMDENIYMAHVLWVDGHIELNNSCAVSNVHPATKVQRNNLEKAMADAGYTFDFKKKELKKIEQKPTEWSEEDERTYKSVLYAFEHRFPLNCEQQEFVKSLRPQKNNWEIVTKGIYFKEPVLVRRKDKSDSWEGYRVCSDYTLNPQTDECYIRIKDINNQKLWKPSKEQMVALDGICSYIRNKAEWEISQDMVSDLYKLSEQLKKLKG